MKSDMKILLAFSLNLIFSIIEFIGGTITGSVAIISDSIHDFGDCLSIGVAFAFEKLSHKKPNDKYTFGYYRYSVLGGVVQSVILLCGSVLVVYNAILRIANPKPIDYNGMIIIAIIGFVINFAAAYFTSGDGSLNQRAINLHMLEDVLGWAIVLIGAVVMRFCDWLFLDPILSILLASFIAINALKNLKIVLNIFLEKAPDDTNISEIREHLLAIEGVKGIHHIHVWSMDGFNNSATLHAVTDSDFSIVKQKIKHELSEHGILHVTIECEKPDEICCDKLCKTDIHEHSHSHSHGHSHHHH